MAIDWARMNPFAKADANMNNPPAPQPPNTNTITDSSGVVPNKDDPKNKNKTDGVGDDPLLNFGELWQPNKDKDGKVINDTKDRNTPYLPQIDPKKFGEMVSKIDFTKSFTSEEVEAVKKGGDEAVSALIGMMNKATRQAFQTSLAASSRLAEQGFATAQQRFLEDIPEHVRNHMLDNDLSSDPIFKNPALQPIVKNVKEQYLGKFPKATPSELNNAVKAYFKYLGGELSKKPENKDDEPQNAKKLRVGDPTANFEEWLGNELLQSRGALNVANESSSDNNQT